MLSGQHQPAEQFGRDARDSPSSGIVGSNLECRKVALWASGTCWLFSNNFDLRATEGSIVSVHDCAAQSDARRQLQRIITWDGFAAILTPGQSRVGEAVDLGHDL